MSDETEGTDEFVAKAMASLQMAKASHEFRERLLQQTSEIVVTRARSRKRLRTVVTHFSSFAAGLATIVIWQAFASDPSDRPFLVTGIVSETGIATESSRRVDPAEKKAPKDEDSSPRDHQYATKAVKPNSSSAMIVPVAARDERISRIESLKREAERKIQNKGDFAAATKLFRRAADLCRAEELEAFSQNDHWLWTSIKTAKREELNDGR